MRCLTFDAVYSIPASVCVDGWMCVHTFKHEYLCKQLANHNKIHWGGERLH